jgi:hypothetical protein
MKLKYSQYLMPQLLSLLRIGNAVSKDGAAMSASEHGLFSRSGVLASISMAPCVLKRSMMQIAGMLGTTWVKKDKQ